MNCKSPRPIRTATAPARWRRIVASLTLLAQLWSSTLPAAVSWPPPQSTQDQLQRALQLTDALEQALPKPTLDMMELAFEFDFDYQTAIDFVLDQHAFVPYPGVLRGPDGALVTGSGNSWDLSLLLAALIKSIGGDAQVVGGSIAAADAERLLERVFMPLPRATDTASIEQMLSALRQSAPELAQGLEQRLKLRDDPAHGAELQRRTGELAAQIQRQLAAAGIEIGNAGEAADASGLIGQLQRDYAFLRWRSGPGQAWQDVHPAFGRLSAPEAEVQRYLADEVPTDLLHRVGLRLVIERLRADGSGRHERVAIMREFERPTANLFKNQLTLGVGPLGGNPEQDQVFAAPLLNGRSPAGAQAFSALGLTADASDAASAAGKLFATLGEGMAGMAGRLGGLGASADEAEKAMPRLTGVLLEARIIAPDGSEKIVERRLADLRERSDVPFPDAATVEVILDFDIGGNHPQALVHEQLARQRQNLEASLPLLAWARGELTLEQARQVPEFREMPESHWLEFERYANAMLPERDANRSGWRPGPMIVTRRTGFDADQQVQVLSDILHNPVTVLGRDAEGAIRVSVAGAVEQGVRETLLESALMGKSDGWSGRSPVRVIAEPGALDQHSAARNWSQQALERATQDLEQNYVLAITDDAEPHWWRIHRQSGETLGMGALGGQEMAEYIVMVISAGLSTYFFYRSVESCDKTYKDNQAMADCCIVGNLAVTYGTSALGAATGGLPTGEAGAWIANPILASVGYIMASLQFELAGNFLVEAISGEPIEAACKAIENW